MRYIGFAGWSGVGKTTLVTHLIKIIKSRNFTISTIKHAHHDFDIDQLGKDSWNHRKAGASEVLISSKKRWALMHEHNINQQEETLDALLAKMTPVDLILVEGFKHAAFDKIEIYRSDLKKPLLAEKDPHIVAIATDNLPETIIDKPILNLNDAEEIADFILKHCALTPNKRVQ